MRTMEFFCGTKSFSKVAEELGYETFTIDIDPTFEPDLCKDIMDLDIEDLPYIPDVLWCSPPCTCFSVASLRWYWEDGKPKNQKVIDHLGFVKKTLDLIDAMIKIKPSMIWFIENPRGMLRKQSIMEGLKRDTITYCQYGYTYQKATDIWNNCMTWKPRSPCSSNSPCHVRAPRGSNTGVQGLRYRGNHPDFRYKSRKGGIIRARAIIPPDLFKEIFKDIS